MIEVGISLRNDGTLQRSLDDSSTRKVDFDKRLFTALWVTFIKNRNYLQQNLDEVKILPNCSNSSAENRWEGRAVCSVLTRNRNHTGLCHVSLFRGSLSGAVGFSSRDEARGWSYVSPLVIQLGIYKKINRHFTILRHSPTSGLLGGFYQRENVTGLTLSARTVSWRVLTVIFLFWCIFSMWSGPSGKNYSAAVQGGVYNQLWQPSTFCYTVMLVSQSVRIAQCCAVVLLMYKVLNDL